MWGHYEKQLMKRELHHQWEYDRVIEEQQELMDLERRKIVSEEHPIVRENLINALKHLYIL
jgi:hypothetical protein